MAKVLKLVKMVFPSFTDPKTIFLGTTLGIIIGKYFKPAIPYLTPLGNAYFDLLMLCILPIIFTSIICGLANMLKVPELAKKTKKLVLIFPLVLLLSTAIAALTTSFLFSKITLPKNQQTEAVFGKSIQTNQQSTTQTIQSNNNETQIESKLSYFLEQITPRNVVLSLQQGLSLKVIIIALLIGVALGKINARPSKYLLETTKAINEIFLKIFNWIIQLLPLGLCFIFASRFKDVDSSTLKMLTKLIVVVYLAYFILIILYNIILCSVLHVSFYKLINTIKKPLFMGAITSSSMIAVPTSITALSKLKINNKLVELLLPLGIMINNQAHVIILFAVSIFSAKFYGIHLDIPTLFMLFAAATLLGACSVGGVVILSTIFVVVAKIIGIPSEIGIIALLSANFSLSWLGVIVTLFANYTVAALVATPFAKQHISEK